MKGLMIIIVIVAFVVGGFIGYQLKSDPLPGEEVDGKLRICPDEWIDNQMPGTVGDPLPSQYFIIDGERRELSEFDIDWIEENCGLGVMVVV
ncbi:MAG: hypothetical protein ABIG28_01200 [archaeon]